MPSKAIQVARFGGVLTPATLASASNVDIGAVNAKVIYLTGTTQINSLGVAPVGVTRTLRFSGQMNINNNSNITLPGGKIITAYPGDTAEMLSQGSGVWICTDFVTATGLPVSGAGPDYIRGLQLVWTSNSSMVVTPGECYVQGTNKVLKNLTNIPLTGISGPAQAGGSVYYVYAYDSGAGVFVAEVVPTPPDVNYYGSASSKTGDLSRRFIGPVRFDDTGKLVNFRHKDDRIDWITNATYFQLASNANNTVSTKLNFQGVACSKIHTAMLGGTNSSPNSSVRLCSTDQGAASASNHSHFLTPGASDNFEMPLGVDISINFIFDSAPTSGGFTLRCNGFKFHR